MLVFLNHLTPTLFSKKSIFSDSKELCLSQGDPLEDSTATILGNAASLRESEVAFCIFPIEEEKKMHKFNL